MAAVPVIFVGGWILWHLGPLKTHGFLFVAEFFTMHFQVRFFSGVLQGFFSGRFAANRFLFGRFSQDLSISF